MPTKSTLTESDKLRIQDAYHAAGLPGAYAAAATAGREVVYRWLVYECIHLPPPYQQSAARPWEADEDEILRRLYESLGAAELVRRGLLDRTRKAITKRADVLGLNAKGGHELAASWSTQDTLKALKFAERENAGERRNWAELHEAFPDRSTASIACKLDAVKKGQGLSLRRAAPRKWAPDHDRYVSDNYETLGAKQIATNLGRSVAAVTNRAYDLGVTKSKPRAG